MITPRQISTISELRFKTKDVLRKAKETPVYLFHRSTPRGVLMSMEKYHELMDSLEDYYLSLETEEYEKEDKDRTEWVRHEKVKKMFS